MGQYIYVIPDYQKAFLYNLIQFQNYQVPNYVAYNPKNYYPYYSNVALNPSKTNNALLNFYKCTRSEEKPISCSPESNSSVTNDNKNSTAENPIHRQRLTNISEEASGSQSLNRINLRKNKKMRGIFTKFQLYRLEEEFNRKPYITGVEKAYLAQSLNMTENQVKVWYQNRRKRHKTMKAEAPPAGFRLFSNQLTCLIPIRSSSFLAEMNNFQM